MPEPQIDRSPLTPPEPQPHTNSWCPVEQKSFLPGANVNCPLCGANLADEQSVQPTRYVGTAKEPSSKRRGLRRYWWVAVLVLIAAVGLPLFILNGDDNEPGVFGADGDIVPSRDAERLANDVCKELLADGVTITAGQGILSSGLVTAEEKGVAGFQLRFALEAECGDVTDAILGSLGVGRWVETIDVIGPFCGGDEVTGQVYNDGDFTFDITLEWEYRSGSERYADGVETIRNLAPGDNTAWSGFLFDQPSDGECFVEISRVSLSR